MNEELGVVSTILILMGIGLCEGEEAFWGVLFIAVGIIMLLSSVGSSQSKNDNSGSNESQNKSNVLLNSTNSNNTSLLNRTNNLNRTSSSNPNVLYTKTYNKIEYKKYVMVRFSSSSKVYTYLSNPRYPLKTGEYVNINGNSGIERVFVVQGDTSMPEKKDMHYKVIPVCDYER